MYVCRSRKFLGVIFAVIAAIGILFYPITSLKSTAAEDYRLWRQSDPRWCDIKLGNSSETVRSSGCLVTSIAILAVHSGSANPETFNPGTFATALNKIDGFSNGAISSWAKITEIIPNVKFVEKYKFVSSTQEGKAAEMKVLSDEGKYLVCNTGGHWVFVDSIVGSDVYMIDPAKDDVMLFEAYNNSNITELRVFTGRYSPENTAPTTEVTETTTEETTAAPIGEYYYTGAEYTKISSSPSDNSEILEYLGYGQLVDVTYVSDGWGLIQLGTENGWVKLNELTYAGVPKEHSIGDINDDGIIDKTDLALLNDYLSSLSELPDGISILRNCEISAADINSDGKIDNNDILKYLELICQ